MPISTLEKSHNSTAVLPPSDVSDTHTYSELQCTRHGAVAAQTIAEHAYVVHRIVL